MVAVLCRRWVACLSHKRRSGAHGVSQRERVGGRFFLSGKYTLFLPLRLSRECLLCEKVRFFVLFASLLRRRRPNPCPAVVLLSKCSALCAVQNAYFELGMCFSESLVRLSWLAPWRACGQFGVSVICRNGVEDFTSEVVLLSL